MIRSFLITLIVIPLLSLSSNASDIFVARDSVGVARKNGKIFVQHKVEPKETLYALSKKYSIPISQIVDANPNVEATIKIGEIVLIPRKAYNSNAVASTASTAPSASSRTYTVNDTGNKIHTVEPNQTLYSIARLHNVSVDEIRRWNNLKDNSISVGTKLIVGMGNSTPTKKPVYIPEPDDEMTKSKSADVAVSTASSAKPEAVSSPANERMEAKEKEGSDSNEAVKRVVEAGMAEMIDPRADTNKYLALHRTAPVGTIMQVKNAMNSQVVYVRVIGKLPETGANDRVIVRISKKAYQKLGAVDQKFRVEVSYMP